MNNGLKALLIAASTIITCMIVTIGFSMAREAKQIGNRVTEELEQYKTTLSERDLMKYDGAAVYGTDIMNLVKTEQTRENAGFCVTIITGSEQVVIQADAKKEEKERAAADAVLAAARYQGKVIRNKNKVITELQFKKMEENYYE